MEAVIIFIVIITLTIIIATASKKKEKVSFEIRTNYNNRQEYYKLREKRRRRHTQIWSVLRFMMTYRYLVNSNNFNYYEANLKSHKEAFGRTRKEHVDISQINAAIRFCQIEHYYGTCDYELSKDDINILKNIDTYTINEEIIMQKTLDSFKSYWDEVLSSYKRKSAYNNRLKRLIEDLDEQMTLPHVKKNEKIVANMRQLQQTYQQLLGIEVTQ